MNKIPVVMVVDDDSGVRNAMRALLKSVGINATLFSSAQEFLSAYDPLQPGCLLLDIRMPGMTGSDLHDELRGRGVRAPVIFITGHGDIPMAVEAMRKGAYDFIEKPFDDEQLLGQVLNALEDVEAAPQPVSLPILSARQHAVLDRVLAGKPNRQIAQELAISLKTVEFHRARIMQKFGVRTAAELFRRCLGSN